MTRYNTREDVIKDLSEEETGIRRNCNGSSLTLAEQLRDARGTWKHAALARPN